MIASRRPQRFLVLVAIGVGLLVNSPRVEARPASKIFSDLITGNTDTAENAENLDYFKKEWRDRETEIAGYSDLPAIVDVMSAAGWTIPQVASRIFELFPQKYSNEQWASLGQKLSGIVVDRGLYRPNSAFLYTLAHRQINFQTRSPKWIAELIQILLQTRSPEQYLEMIYEVRRHTSDRFQRKDLTIQLLDATYFHLEQMPDFGLARVIQTYESLEDIKYSPLALKLKKRAGDLFLEAWIRSDPRIYSHSDYFSLGTLNRIFHWKISGPESAQLSLEILRDFLSQVDLAKIYNFLPRAHHADGIYGLDHQIRFWKSSLAEALPSAELTQLLADLDQIEVDAKNVPHFDQSLLRAEFASDAMRQFAVFAEALLPHQPNPIAIQKLYEMGFQIRNQIRSPSRERRGWDYYQYPKNSYLRKDVALKAFLLGDAGAAYRLGDRKFELRLLNQLRDEIEDAKSSLAQHSALSPPLARAIDELLAEFPRKLRLPFLRDAWAAGLYDDFVNRWSKLISDSKDAQAIITVIPLSERRLGVEDHLFILNRLRKKFSEFHGTVRYESELRQDGLRLAQAPASEWPQSSWKRAIRPLDRTLAETETILTELSQSNLNLSSVRQLKVQLTKNLYWIKGNGASQSLSYQKVQDFYGRIEKSPFFKPKMPRWVRGTILSPDTATDIIADLLAEFGASQQLLQQVRDSKFIPCDQFASDLDRFLAMLSVPEALKLAAIAEPAPPTIIESEPTSITDTADVSIPVVEAEAAPLQIQYLSQADAQPLQIVDRPSNLLNAYQLFENRLFNQRNPHHHFRLAENADDLNPTAPTAELAPPLPELTNDQACGPKLRTLADN